MSLDVDEAQRQLDAVSSWSEKADARRKLDAALSDENFRHNLRYQDDLDARQGAHSRVSSGTEQSAPMLMALAFVVLVPVVAAITSTLGITNPYIWGFKSSLSLFALMFGALIAPRFKLLSAAYIGYGLYYFVPVFSDGVSLQDIERNVGRSAPLSGFSISCGSDIGGTDQWRQRRVPLHKQVDSCIP